MALGSFVLRFAPSAQSCNVRERCWQARTAALSARRGTNCLRTRCLHGCLASQELRAEGKQPALSAEETSACAVLLAPRAAACALCARSLSWLLVGTSSFPGLQPTFSQVKHVQKGSASLPASAPVCSAPGVAGELRRYLHHLRYRLLSETLG